METGRGAQGSRRHRPIEIHLQFTQETGMSKITMIGAAAVLMLSALSAAAGWPNDGTGVDARQQRQQARIGDGIRSGDLTRREAHSLQREHGAIGREARIHRSDGVVTDAERRDLNGDLNIASRHIYNQRHDNDRRWGHPDWRRGNRWDHCRVHGYDNANDGWCGWERRDRWDHWNRWDHRKRWDRCRVNGLDRNNGGWCD
jgi:hypothetical protein